jgi:hypothetical protein
MTVRNGEKSSPDWPAIRRRYEREPISIKRLARESGTNDMAIHRRAKADGWVLYSALPRVQQQAQPRVQHAEGNARPWDVAPRRDALLTALTRSRAGIETVVDSIYCDLPVVMSLLWFRTPLSEIARAVQLTEPQLEEFFGPAIFKFVHEYYGGPQQDRPRRSRRKAA